MTDHLLDTARNRFGLSYLYIYQRLVITNILEASRHRDHFNENEDHEERQIREKQIVLLPSGGGKSLCFMLPAFLLPGITLVVFPLLALMNDQQRRCSAAGLPTAVFKGGQSRTERDELFKKLRAGRIRMILTNPESLLNEGMLARLEGLPLDHFVIDEAHTIAEWGQTFRPAFLALGKIPLRLGIRQITAFTATASPPILQTIRDVLFSDTPPHLIAAQPDRPNIRYSVLPSLAPRRTARLLLAKTVEAPALIFCRKRREAEEMTLYLRRMLGGDRIFFYHAGLTRREKKAREEWFFQSDNGLLCATTAYGMGVDKPNIRSVIHLSPSLSVEGYLQESGRAGRDGAPAKAMVLLSPEAGKEPRQGESHRLAPFSDPLRCRRKALLTILGDPPEHCAGCDVCDGRAVRYPPELPLFLAFFRRFNAVLTSKEVRQKLAGRGAGFRGALPDWAPDDIDDAVRNLFTMGLLRRTGKKGGKIGLTPRAPHKKKVSFRKT